MLSCVNITHNNPRHIYLDVFILQKFVDSSKLKRHHLTHTGQKDFICPHPDCGKVMHSYLSVSQDMHSLISIGISSIAFTVALLLSAFIICLVFSLLSSPYYSDTYAILVAMLHFASSYKLVLLISGLLIGF
jgi:hypothetical protein